MRAQLRQAWRSRAPRERMLVAALAVVVGVALYIWLVQAGWQARTRLHASVALLQEQAARMDQQAQELARLRAAPAGAASNGDLRTLMQARIEGAGLAHALVRIDAADANQVQVVFGALPFADWLAWVANLQAQQVRLDAGRIEALATPGMVSVSATFTRAR
jgi:general secretion pathway protein M